MSDEHPPKTWPHPCNPASPCPHRESCAEAFADGWRRGSTEQRMDFVRQTGDFPPDESELLLLRKENAELKIKLGMTP